MKKIFLLFLTCILTLPKSTHASDSPETLAVDHKTEIVFGQSGSFTGHFAFYGEAIRSAILACFNNVNDAGGIGGKKLRLVSLDDHGDAEYTKQNVELLYHKHGITQFLGVMGTRGILSVLPRIKEEKIAMFFPWGGDEALRNPSLTHIINGLGVLEPQVDALATHIVKDLKIKKVAIFHADDSFSSDAATKLANELKDLNASPVGIAEYNRFTMDIARPAQQLLDKDPKVVICISTSQPAVKLINYFFEQGHFDTRFFGVDSTFLVQDILQYKGASFHYASSVPDPRTSDIQLATDYQRDLKHYFPDQDLSVLSFAYYVSASIIVHAAQQIAQSVTPESLLKEITAMTDTTIKGFPVHFDPKNRHAFGKKIWII